MAKKVEVVMIAVLYAVHSAKTRQDQVVGAVIVVLFVPLNVKGTPNNQVACVQVLHV